MVRSDPEKVQNIRMQEGHFYCGWFKMWITQRAVFGHTQKSISALVGSRERDNEKVGSWSLWILLKSLSFCPAKSQRYIRLKPSSSILSLTIFRRNGKSDIGFVRIAVPDAFRQWQYAFNINLNVLRAMGFNGLIWTCLAEQERFSSVVAETFKEVITYSF